MEPEGGGVMHRCVRLTVPMDERPRDEGKVCVILLALALVYKLIVAKMELSLFGCTQEPANPTYQNEILRKLHSNFFFVKYLLF